MTAPEVLYCGKTARRIEWIPAMETSMGCDDSYLTVMMVGCVPG